MRILVVGSTGQVAQSLSDLNQADPDCDIICRGRPDIDLTNPDTIERTINDLQPDCIINAAAYTAVDQAEQEEELALTVNGDGPGYLGQYAKNANVPVVHISTDYVFDGQKTTGYSEGDPVSPLQAYGRSKLAGEEKLASATDNHAILRTSWVFSPYGKNFVKTMLRLAAERDELTIVHDQIGCPTSAGEIARTSLDVANRLAAEPDNTELRGVFHYAGPQQMSWAQFAEHILAASKAMDGPWARVTPIPTTEFPTPAERPKNSILDCQKGKNIFGFSHISIEEALRPIVTHMVRPLTEQA